MSNKRSKSHLSNSSQNEKQNRISNESPDQKHNKKQHAMDRKVMFLVLLMVVVAVLYFVSSFLLNTSKPSINDVRISGDEHKSIMDHTRTILSFGERLVTHQKRSVRANDGDDLNKKSGHERTLEYLASQFNPNKWRIEYDTQSHHTVLGKLNFTNLIVTWKNPVQISSYQRKRIILAAHYESKIMNSNEAPPRVFLGATDSVVPCAMMINFAHAYEQSKLYSTSQSAYDVQLVFFDGEEAFVQWSPNDSIYGARQLAQKWDKEDKLNSIHLFLLLDLIGTKDVRFYNYGIHFESHTHQLFSQLSVFENQLRGNSELKSEQKYFFDARVNELIEDDHIPFYRKKVPVLHLIPTPFPSVWHTFDDDLSALDEHVIEDLQKILVRFLLKYLA